MYERGMFIVSLNLDRIQRAAGREGLKFGKGVR